MKALVENAKEIDLEVKDHYKHTPLITACIAGDYKIAEYLIQKGASIVETRGQKKSPLIYAIKNGQIHIVSLLLRKGAHPDCYDSSGNTPLHYAAAFGWLNIVQFLIKSGADPNHRNEWNTTPTMLAMLKNHFGILDYLLNLKEVEKDLVDNNGRSVSFKSQITKFRSLHNSVQILTLTL